MAAKKSFKLTQGKTDIIHIGILLVVAAVIVSIVIAFSGEQSELTNSIFSKRKRQARTEDRAVASAPSLPSGISMAVSENTEILPEGLAKIPLNSKKEIIRSYTLNYPQGEQKQGVINFISSKSVGENFKFYKNWATQNSWTILYQLENGRQSILNIKKEKTVLTISISQDNKNSGDSEINISE